MIKNTQERNYLKMINPANLCIFEGRMVRDPQVSNVQFGQDTVEKALFTIAVDRSLSSANRLKVKNGDQSIKTADFIPCSLLGAQVATLKQWFPVGKAIRVMGHYTEYQTTDQQTGQKKYGHMFEIDNISFPTQDAKSLQSNGGAQQQNNGGYQQNNNQNQGGYQQNQQPAQQQPNNNFAMFDEAESPF